MFLAKIHPPRQVHKQKLPPRRERAAGALQELPCGWSSSTSDGGVGLTKAKARRLGEAGVGRDYSDSGEIGLGLGT